MPTMLTDSPSGRPPEKRIALTRLTPGTFATAPATCGVDGEKPSVFWMIACAREPVVTAVRIVFRALEAKIDAKQTRATPPISAAAVAAVRLGWRMAFS